jgi:predicted RNA binding protein YcfA (HicA-like mRNA interferase family)
MSKLRALTGKEVTAALERAGFSFIRTRSSHHFMRHPDDGGSIHAGETIGPSLMGKILRDCELTREEFALLL